MSSREIGCFFAKKRRDICHAAENGIKASICRCKRIIAVYKPAIALEFGVQSGILDDNSGKSEKYFAE